MLQNYQKNQDGLIHQANYDIIEYNKEYINNRYNTYGYLNEYISHLRLGYIIGTIGKIPNSLMDIGYGNGSFLKTCLNVINNCYGYDISTYPIPDGAKFIDNWISHSVEVVTFFDTLEHFTDPYIIKDIKTEYIIISLPWCHYHSDEWFKNWKHRRPNEHLWFFNEKNIFNYALSTGYQIINFCNIEDTIRKPLNNEKNILTFTLKKSSI